MKSLLLFVFLIFFIDSVFALCESNQIDINTASAEELDNLTGIGPVYADRIIQSRPFSSLEDLLNVSGIGNVTLNKIKTQGLACVSGKLTPSNSTNNASLGEESRKEQNPSPKPSNIQIEEEVKEDSSSLETIFLSNNNESTSINLNPKTIKTAENSSLQGKEKYVYLLLGFCGLLAFLYLIQNKGKTKNEFR